MTTIHDDFSVLGARIVMVVCIGIAALVMGGIVASELEAAFAALGEVLR